MPIEDSSEADWKDYLTDREKGYEKALTGAVSFIRPTAGQVMYGLLRTIAELRKANKRGLE